MGVDIAKTEPHVVEVSKDIMNAVALKSQPWKSQWPPSTPVQPGGEQATAGKAIILQGGGGAYPNNIRPTEGVRL